MASKQVNAEVNPETPRASSQFKNMDRRKVLPKLPRFTTLSELTEEYNRTQDWWMFRSRAWAHVPFPSLAYDQLSALNPFSKCPVWEACARNYTELLVVLMNAGLDVPTLNRRDKEAVLRRIRAWGYEPVASELYCRQVARRGQVPGIPRDKSGEYLSKVRILQEDYNGYLMALKFQKKSEC